MNMRKAIYTLLLLPLMALTGCVNDGLEPCPSDTPTGYLELTVTTGGTTASRANPTGGEEGDGYEHGRGKENNIYDLSIFIYVDRGEGLDGDYPIIWRKYIDEATVNANRPSNAIDRIYNVRIPLEKGDFADLRLDKGTLRAVVVANTGNQLDNIQKNSGLREICDNLNYGSAWTVSNNAFPAAADRFVMSSAFNGAKERNNDGLIRVSNTETDGTIYSSEVTLERVAARIDLQVTTDNILSGKEGLHYKIVDCNNSLTLLNAIPVNLMQNSSYLVKRVTEGTDRDKWLVAGNENMDNRGEPTNYVLTPDFGKKPNDNNVDPGELLDQWYGVSRAEQLRSNDKLDALSAIDATLLNTAFQFEGASATQRAIVLNYANENTHPLDAQVTNRPEAGMTHVSKASDYLTGLLFRAQYHPAEIRRLENGVLVTKTDYADGSDFWLLRIVGANGTNAVEEKFNLYFDSQVALNKYITDNLSSIGRYETVPYPGGICYYNIWIKHANIDGSDENFPMKYGIVRNNIYRISLNFNGIGQPKPEITEPYNITSRIYVIKWNFRPQPEIIM